MNMVKPCRVKKRTIRGKKRKGFNGFKQRKDDVVNSKVNYLLFIKNFIYRWHIKIAFANKFQPYHKIQYNIYYVSLHIKHPQSISPIFLILFLNSNNELLDFTTAGRLFHIREPRK